MTVNQFKALKTGDKVFAVLNTGIAGIAEYQYIGIFTDHDGIEKHVLLSQYFLSTLVCTHGRENTSRTPKSIFLRKDEAIDYKNFLIESEKETV